MEQLINKVEEAGLITLDPEAWYFSENIDVFDLADGKDSSGLIREKHLKEFFNQFDFSKYQNKIVSVVCSDKDILVPHWAYMWAVRSIRPFAKEVYALDEFAIRMFKTLQKIEQINEEEYKDKRILIKGCSKMDLPSYVYAALTQKLMPVARSIMYGEACSAVPVYKKR